MSGRRRPAQAPLLAVACLALSACGEPAAEGDRATDRNDVAGQLARVDVRPGLWEATREILSVSQQDLPHAVAEGMKGRRTVDRHCITPEQAARPDGNFLAGRRARNCRYSGFEMREGRIAGAMTCRDADGSETRARMSGRYGPEAYEMRIEMETPGIGRDRTMTVVTRQAGRRVGECSETGETKR